MQRSHIVSTLFSCMINTREVLTDGIELSHHNGARFWDWALATCFLLPRHHCAFMTIQGRRPGRRFFSWKPEFWVWFCFFFSSLFVPQLWTKCNRMSPRAPLLNVPGGLDNIDNKCRWQGLAMEAELLDRLALDFPLMMFPGCTQSTHLRILACTPVIGRSSESDGWQGCLRCSCRCCHDAGC